MKTLLVAVVSALAFLSGCVGATESGPLSSESSPAQVSESVTAQCVSREADTVYPGAERADVEFSVLATIHQANGEETYQLPAFEPVEGGYRAAVTCFDGSYAVFTRVRAAGAQ